MIYFAQPVGGGPIKIGQSIAVAARIRQLESYYGRPLVLLGTMPGGRDKEQEIHAQFSHLRFGRTEQFRPEADLLAFIGCVETAVDSPSTAEAMPVAKARAATFIRSSEEWKAWIEELAKFDRGSSVAELIDRAAVDYAKEIGFDEPAPRR